MGGVARYLEEGAKLGVHRFYNKAAIDNYSARQFSGGDLDATQRIFAALVLYLLQMGVKAQVIGLTDQAGPDENVLDIFQRSRGFTSYLRSKSMDALDT
jgi:hypothetical protein